MSTIIKKELIDRISTETHQKRTQIKRVVQMFLDEIVEELGRGNRLEFRDFGVFESRTRKARRAQNPRTLQPVRVLAGRGSGGPFRPGCSHLDGWGFQSLVKQ